ncbi:hypothetical protein LCGC14_1009200 [marine sediment metagenome]|uniref:Uncharacterized protein n=1 Tax=marine sediment metagenome TaxID=412755 RepID=A0A0F9QJ09_9ZZZZ
MNTPQHDGIEITPGWNVLKESGTTYFIQGEIRIPLDPESLRRSVENVGRVPLADLRTLAGINHLPVDPAPPQDLLLPVIAGMVQYIWYREIKGSIPDRVIENQLIRVSHYKSSMREFKENPNKFKTTKAAGKRGRPRGQKALTKVWQVGCSPDTPNYSIREETHRVSKWGAGLKGHQSLIYEAMANGAKIIPEIAAGIEASGELVSKMKPEAVVKFYLWRWAKDGNVHEVEGQRELPPEAIQTIVTKKKRR